MNVIRIHPEVAPRPTIVVPDEKLRRVYWKGAKDYFRTAKQVRSAGQPGLASKILASGRQAIAIATAPNPGAMLHSLVREERSTTPEHCFVETCHSEPIPGTPVPLRCPFCGDPGMVSITERCGPESEYGASYIAECQGCGAEGPSGSTQLEAATAWNTRPDRRQEAGQ